MPKARARFRHSGDKGTSAEDGFRAFLREYLPRRLAVGQGGIVDSLGNRSAQTDVIIASEDHAYTFTENSPGLFFVEGIVGAGEVKAVLTTTHLEQSIQNSRRFKALKLMPGTGTLTCANPSDLERYYVSPPPWFLFAYESQISLSAICKRLDDESRNDTGIATNLVDAVFILGVGWLINFGDGNGTLEFRNPEAVRLTGWIWKPDNSALFQLMAWLSSVMPRVVRF